MRLRALDDALHDHGASPSTGRRAEAAMDEHERARRSRASDARRPELKPRLRSRHESGKRAPGSIEGLLRWVFFSAAADTTARKNGGFSAHGEARGNPAAHADRAIYEPRHRMGGSAAISRPRRGVVEDRPGADGRPMMVRMVVGLPAPLRTSRQTPELIQRRRDDVQDVAVAE